MKTWRNHQKYMYTYAHSLWVISTETVSSDKVEELKIFADIMKLVPSFKDVVMACSDHQCVLVNLIQMVSFHLLKCHINSDSDVLFIRYKLPPKVQGMTTLG